MRAVKRIFEYYQKSRLAINIRSETTDRKGATEQINDLLALMEGLTAPDIDAGTRRELADFLKEQAKGKLANVYRKPEEFMKKADKKSPRKLAPAAADLLQTEARAHPGGARLPLSRRAGGFARSRDPRGSGPFCGGEAPGGVRAPRATAPEGGTRCGASVMSPVRPRSWKNPGGLLPPVLPPGRALESGRSPWRRSPAECRRCPRLPDGVCPSAWVLMDGRPVGTSDS